MAQTPPLAHRNKQAASCAVMEARKNEAHLYLQMEI